MRGTEILHAAWHTQRGEKKQTNKRKGPLEAEKGKRFSPIAFRRNTALQHLNFRNSDLQNFNTVSFQVTKFEAIFLQQ